MFKNPMHSSSNKENSSSPFFSTSASPLTKWDDDVFINKYNKIALKRGLTSSDQTIQEKSALTLLTCIHATLGDNYSFDDILKTRETYKENYRFHVGYKLQDYCQNQSNTKEDVFAYSAVAGAILLSTTNGVSWPTTLLAVGTTLYNSSTTKKLTSANCISEYLLNNAYCSGDILIDQILDNVHKKHGRSFYLYLQNNDPWFKENCIASRDNFPLSKFAMPKNILDIIYNTSSSAVETAMLGHHYPVALQGNDYRESLIKDRLTEIYDYAKKEQQKEKVELAHAIAVHLVIPVLTSVIGKYCDKTTATKFSVIGSAGANILYHTALYTLSGGAISAYQLCTRLTQSLSPLIQFFLAENETPSTGMIEFLFKNIELQNRYLQELKSLLLNFREDCFNKLNVIQTSLNVHMNLYSDQEYEKEFNDLLKTADKLYLLLTSNEFTKKEYANYLIDIFSHANRTAVLPVFSGYSQQTLSSEKIMLQLSQRNRFDLRIGLLHQHPLNYRKQKLFPIKVPNPLHWGRSAIIFLNAREMKSNLQSLEYDKMLNELLWAGEAINTCCNQFLQSVNMETLETSVNKYTKINCKDLANLIVESMKEISPLYKNYESLLLTGLPPLTKHTALETKNISDTYFLQESHKLKVTGFATRSQNTFFYEFIDKDSSSKICNLYRTPDLMLNNEKLDWHQNPFFEIKETLFNGTLSGRTINNLELTFKIAPLTGCIIKGFSYILDSSAKVYIWGTMHNGWYPNSIDSFKKHLLNLGLPETTLPSIFHKKENNNISSENKFIHFYDFLIILINFALKYEFNALCNTTNSFYEKVRNKINELAYIPDYLNLLSVMHSQVTEYKMMGGFVLDEENFRLLQDEFSWEGALDELANKDRSQEKNINVQQIIENNLTNQMTKITDLFKCLKKMSFSDFRLPVVDYVYNRALQFAIRHDRLANLTALHKYIDISKFNKNLPNVITPKKNIIGYKNALAGTFNTFIYSFLSTVPTFFAIPILTNAIKLIEQIINNLRQRSTTYSMFFSENVGLISLIKYAVLNTLTITFIDASIRTLSTNKYSFFHHHYSYSPQEVMLDTGLKTFFANILLCLYLFKDKTTTERILSSIVIAGQISASSALMDGFITHANKNKQSLFIDEKESTARTKEDNILNRCSIL